MKHLGFDLRRDGDARGTATTGYVHLAGIVIITRTLYRCCILKAIRTLRLRRKVGF